MIKFSNEWARGMFDSALLLVILPFALVFLLFTGVFYLLLWLWMSFTGAVFGRERKAAPEDFEGYD